MKPSQKSKPAVLSTTLMRSLPKSTRIMFTPNSGDKVRVHSEEDKRVSRNHFYIVFTLIQITRKVNQALFTFIYMFMFSSMWTHCGQLFANYYNGDIRWTPQGRLQKNSSVPCARKSSSAGGLIFKANIIFCFENVIFCF